MTKQTITVVIQGADGEDGKAYGKGAVAGKGGKGGTIYYRGGNGGDAIVIGRGYARGGDGGDVIGEVPDRELRIERIARRFAAFCFLMSAVFFIGSMLLFAGVMP